MAFSKESIELSQRAGKVFSIIDKKTANEIRPIITNVKSFNDLPKYVQNIIIEAENEIKKNPTIV